MLVKDIMRKRPRSIMPETCVAEAMSLMRFYRIDSLPVAAKQLIVNGNRSVMPDTPLNQAMAIMLNQQITRLAVTEGGRLVGLISFDDINKTILGITSTRAAA